MSTKKPGLNGIASIKSLRIIVTTRCNAKLLKPQADSPGVCEFCYRQKEQVSDDRKTIDQLLKNISKNPNIRSLIFTGGEPLVSRNLRYLLKSAFSLGFHNTLHTNGLTLEKNKETLNYLICVSLPLDGSNAKIADYYRGVGYFKTLQNCLDLLHANAKNIGLHTLLTPYNISDLENMAAVAQKHAPMYWFIKQFRAANLAAGSNSKHYGLETPQFQKSVQDLIHKYPSLNIFASASSGMPSQTLFVYLDGCVFAHMPGCQDNVLIGNLLSDSWEELAISFANYQANPAH